MQAVTGGALAMTLMACYGGAPGGPTQCPSGTDADVDGSCTPDDCNDEDGSIYPGAVEVPGDGIDQDCDGQDSPDGSGGSGGSGGAGGSGGRGGAGGSGGSGGSGGANP